MYKNSEDNILFEAWSKGDPSGFAKLYEKYKSRLYGFLIKMTRDKNSAEDLMQETFLAAYRNAGQFDKKRNFLSWLFGIAHKKTIDYFRHNNVVKDNKNSHKLLNGSGFDRQDDIVSGHELKNIINKEIEKLDSLQREVLLMRVLGNIKFKEIAKITDCPLNTVLGRMHYAHSKIRKKLREQYIQELPS